MTNQTTTIADLHDWLVHHITNTYKPAAEDLDLMSLLKLLEHEASNRGFTRGFKIGRRLGGFGKCTGF